MIKKIIMASLLASFSFAASQTSKEYGICMDNTSGATQPMLDCISREIKVQDAILTKYYKLLMKSLESTKQAELKKVELSWIKYRDEKCNFYYGLSGGSIDRINSTSCYLDETMTRADELKWLSNFVAQ